MVEDYQTINLAGFEKSVVPYGRNKGKFSLSLFFGGCSFNCVWCNKRHYKAKKEKDNIPINSVFRIIEENHQDIIFISGGEPLEQYQSLLILVSHILTNYKNTLIEIDTSGLIDGRNLKEAFRLKNIRFICDFKPKSAGLLKEPVLDWVYALDSEDDLLFPVSNETDVEGIANSRNIIKQFKARKYIMPLYQRLSYEETIELIYKYNLSNFILEIPNTYFSKSIYAV